MTAYEIISIVGIASVLGAFMYIGRKLQILDDLKQTTSKIKINVKVISDHLTSSSADFNHTELQAYSPLQLTKSGQKLIKDFGFEKVYQEHTQDFWNFIDSEEPKLKYDVEKAAIKAVTALYAKDYLSFLKVFFYNNPDRNITNTAPTLGIFVRDKYLEEHPEITE